MKVLVIFTIFSIALGGSLFSVPNTGESCDRTPVYNISVFTVIPFPPAASEQYTVFMSGVFLAKESIVDITIGSRYDRKSWTYTYQAVNKEFQKNEAANFTISIQAPSLKGSYTEQFTLHRSDRSYVSCWQYDYSVA